jgi:hypothetical protein
MPEPIPVEPPGGYAAVQLLARPGSALSGEAAALCSSAAALMESARRSEILFGAKAATLSRLWSLVDECGNANWDGEGALPVEDRAAMAAADFILALPDDVPLPDLSPEPDGSIGLDWLPSRQSALSLSIGTSGRLAYAWSDGSDRGHAVERFDGQRIPPRILASIRGIMNRADAPLRAA